ncbi:MULTISPECIES: sensor histidine kinase [Pseudofrankia]|uniref:sensor histidine kinase n=1 Tax=Pseudofrankia TaxID=2994363 RepID=UPI000234D8B6|nr:MULTISPECIES: sensor histidine kinase [Pseudofrankia]
MRSPTARGWGGRGLGAALRTAYGARAWRECLYALVSLPTACVGVAAVVATVLVGALSATVFVVAPVLIPVLAFDRGLANVQRWLAGSLLWLPVARPDRPRRRRGVLGFLTYHLADPVAWRAVGCFAVRIPAGAVQFAAGFLPWAYGATFLFYPVLSKVIGSREADAGRAERSYGFQLGHFYLDSWPLGLAVSCVGVLVLAAAPWLTRAVLGLDRWLLPKLLGPSDSSLRIRELEETRLHAVNEAASTLRRVERDLHDGAQAQLVALGMRLGRAESRLDKADVARARELVRESRDEVKTIIVNLRELVRGIHPPALDAGLEPALATLAARGLIPTTVRVDLPSRPPASVETMLYFATTELLANAGKHSQATACSIGIATDSDTLRLTVSDDGIGGASYAGAGSGLRGLAERVHTLGGSLAVSSPPGGPTMITVDVPFRDRKTEADPCG